MYVTFKIYYTTLYNIQVATLSAYNRHFENRCDLSIDFVLYETVKT